MSMLFVTKECLCVNVTNVTLLLSQQAVLLAIPKLTIPERSGPGLESGFEFRNGDNEPSYSPVPANSKDVMGIDSQYLQLNGVVK